MVKTINGLKINYEEKGEGDLIVFSAAESAGNDKATSSCFCTAGAVISSSLLIS